MNAKSGKSNSGLAVNQSEVALTSESTTKLRFNIPFTLETLSYNKGFFLAFVVGFVVRLIPEILSYPYPIGWDTIYYAARINNGVVWNQWSDFFSTWLIYGILVTLGNLTTLEPFMLLKVVAPLLYGGTTAGIYFVAWKKLNWSVTKSLLTSAIFAFQLAALGISWHFYRNIFGLAMLLFTIPLLKNDVSWKEAAVLSLLSLLVVWGHELAAVSLFFMVLGLLVVSIFKKERVPYKPFIAIIPAVAVFLIGAFQVFHTPINVEPNILWIKDSVFPHPGGIFFLTDYLNVFTPVEHYASYVELFSHVFSLFILLYAVSLPLIAVGHFRDRVLGSWVIILLVGSFSCLIIPFSALLYWNRWMLMLVFPFTYFAVEGLWKVTKCGKTSSFTGFPNWFKITKKVGIGLSLLTVVLGGLFMSWPLIEGKYGVIGIESTFRYFPSTMQTSSVPLQDTEGTIQSFEWLNEHMTNDSSVLVHDVFHYWSQIYLNPSHTAVFFNNDIQKASDYALENGFTTAYIVWWNEDIGWYNMRLSNDEYVSVFDSGRISIYYKI